MVGSAGGSDSANRWTVLFSADGCTAVRAKSSASPTVRLDTAAVDDSDAVFEDDASEVADGANVPLIPADEKSSRRWTDMVCSGAVDGAVGWTGVDEGAMAVRWTGTEGVGVPG